MTVIDLGCGSGGILKELAKSFPNHEFIVIEWDKILYSFCCKSGKGLSNLHFIKQDFFQYNIKNADIIICFTMPQLVEKLSEKF